MDALVRDRELIAGSQSEHESISEPKIFASLSTVMSESRRRWRPRIKRSRWCRVPAWSGNRWLGDHLGSKTRIGAPYFELLGERDVTREAEQHAVVIEELQMLAGLRRSSSVRTPASARTFCRSVTLICRRRKIRSSVSSRWTTTSMSARPGAASFPRSSRPSRVAVGVPLEAGKGRDRDPAPGGRLTRGVQSRPPQAQAGEGLHQTQRARDRGRGRNRFKT